VKPVNEGGTILVQFRPIFESLGYNVTYSMSGGKLYIQGEMNGRIVTFIIGEKTAIVEGKQQTLGVAPKRINGNTMVPLRFIAEASGYEVIWKPNIKKIEITYTQGNMQISNSTEKTTTNSVMTDNLFEYKNEFEWGTSVSTLKAAKKTSPVLERTNSDGNKEVVYVSSFGGNDGRLGYTFDSSGLIEVMYLSNFKKDFKGLLSTYAGCYMDLSYLYNNGEGPDDKKWDAKATTIQAYEEIYANDTRGMVEMAMRSNELTLLAQYNTAGTGINLIMNNSGTFSDPEYVVGLNYFKK
jgi:hypothetical protein